MTIQELNNEQLLDMYDVQMFYEGDTLKDVRNEILSRMKSYRRPGTLGYHDVDKYYKE